MPKYYLYECGKMNQSYAMKDENNRVVYEANLIQFHLFTACDYEFVNRQTGVTTTHKLGKVTNTTVNDMVVSSSFTLDKMAIFRVLDQRGCYVQTTRVLSLHPEVTLFQDGREIALFRHDVMRERDANTMGIGKKSLQLEITTQSDDMDLIFLAGLALRRCDMAITQL